MGDLQSLAQALERHFNANDTYVGSGTVGGAPSVFPSESPVDGGDKYYDLTTEALSATGYTLRATPKGAQAGDGIIELSFTGARSWDEDNDGSFSATENDWDKG
ncbi:MAG: type IV pilin protein [Pseudomonadales bacterium]|nr:type IV pilin protein [Pseudomonadales bacterium]